MFGLKVENVVKALNDIFDIMKRSNHIQKCRSHIPLSKSKFERESDPQVTQAIPTPTSKRRW